MSGQGPPFCRRKCLNPALLVLGLALASCRPGSNQALATNDTPPALVAGLGAPISAAAVAIDPSGQHLAAVNPDSGSITLIDGLGQPSFGAARELAVGADPRTLSFTPDGTQVLVAAYGSGTLTFVSVLTGQVEAQVPTGGRSYGVVAGTRQANVSLAGPPQVLAL